MRPKQANALRSRIVHTLANEGGELVARMNLGSREVGALALKPGGIAQIGYSSVDPAFQGMGLGRKLYGETMRLMPEGRLASDTSVSAQAHGVWKRLAENPKYQVLHNPHTNPDAIRTAPHYVGQLPERAWKSSTLLVQPAPTALATAQRLPPGNRTVPVQQRRNWFQKEIDAKNDFLHNDLYPKTDTPMSPEQRGALRAQIKSVREEVALLTRKSDILHLRRERMHSLTTPARREEINRLLAGVEKNAAFPSVKVLGEFFSKLSAKPIVSDALRVAHGTTENLATGSSLSLAALSALGEHAAPRVVQKVAPAVDAVTRTLSPYYGLNQMAGRNWRRNPLSPLNING